MMQLKRATYQPLRVRPDSARLNTCCAVTSWIIDVDRQYRHVSGVNSKRGISKRKRNACSRRARNRTLLGITFTTKHGYDCQGVRRRGDDESGTSVKNGSAPGHACVLSIDRDCVYSALPEPYLADIGDSNKGVGDEFSGVQSAECNFTVVELISET